MNTATICDDINMKRHRSGLRLGGDGGNCGCAGCAGCCTGPRGPAGPAGSFLGYADFYAILTPDSAIAIQSGGDVPFPLDGCAGGGTAISRISPATFLLPAAGAYLVSFSVPVSGAGQLSIAVNGAELPYAVFATAAFAINGSAIVSASAPSALSIRNPASGAGTVTAAPHICAAVPVSAHLTVIRLA